MKKLFIVLFCCLGLMNIYAQEEVEEDFLVSEDEILQTDKERMYEESFMYVTDDMYGPAVIDTYKDGRIFWTSWKSNWFVTADVGVEKKIFTTPIEGVDLYTTPTYAIAVGKWVSPFLGLQFKYNYSPITGVCSLSNSFADADGNLSGSLNTFHLDILLDVIGVIRGYKYNRFYRFVPYIGFGASVPCDNDSYYVKDYITYGVINTFRINKWFGAKLTLKTSPSNMGHYGHDGDNATYRRSRINPVALSAGIIYRFNPRTSGFKHNIPEGMDELVKRKVREEILDSLANLPVVGDTMNLALGDGDAPCVQDTVILDSAVKEIYFAGSVVHFALSSSVLTKTARVNLKFLADAIKEIGANRVYEVIGYCDMQTGSVEYNIKLSARRAKAVYDCLVNEFGIDPSQLTIDSKGGVDIMWFEDNELSRCVTIR